MNRLQLVNALSVESSIAGNGVTTTTEQTGENQRLVSWIDQAYEDVQNEYFDWNFLRAKGSFVTQTNTNIIQPPSDLNIWDKKRVYDDGRLNIQVTDYDDCMDCVDESVTGKPNELLLNTDNTLLAYPYPDKAYTYTFDYFRRPYVMTADTDEPAFPSQFHRVIIGRALIYYGNYESAPEMISQGSQIYTTVMRELTASQAGGKRGYYGLSDASDIQVVAQ